MCISPIKIKGRSVPCGRCPECSELSRMEWRTRVYFETLRIQRDKGFIVYSTHTYNDEHVPHLNLAKRYKYIGVHLPDDYNKDILCFRHQDWTEYTKVIRSQIDRDGTFISLRYFVASEYGSDEVYEDDKGRTRRATHRPHYHCLWFVDAPISFFPYFRQLVADKWVHGNVTFTCDPSDNNPANAGLVNGLRPSMYVSKYISKPFDDDYVLKASFDLVKGAYGYCKDIDIPLSLFQKTHKIALASVTPRHFQSVGLGSCFKEFTSPKMLDKGYVRMPLYDKRTSTIVNSDVVFPRYFDRKYNRTLRQPRDSRLKSKKYFLHWAGARRYYENCMQSIEDLCTTVRDMYTDFAAHPLNFSRFAYVLDLFAFEDYGNLAYCYFWLEKGEKQRVLDNFSEYDFEHLSWWCACLREYILASRRAHCDELQENRKVAAQGKQLKKRLHHSNTIAKGNYITYKK